MCFLVNSNFSLRVVFYGFSTFATGFREKRVLGEKLSFAKAVYFIVFPLWAPLGDLIFLLFCRTVDKSEQKPHTKMGSRMKPVCNSTALWAPAARGTSRGLAPPAPHLLQRGPGRGPVCRRVKLILVDACRRSILCGMCLIVEKPESSHPGSNQD